MRWLLCLQCRTAWTSSAPPSPARDWCHGSEPVDCRPGTSDARVWYQSATSSKIGQIVAVRYRDRWEHQESIASGVERSGRTWRVVA